MSAKVYWLQFGTGNPRTYTGLAPTFLQFFDNTGQTLLAPAISEIKFGGVTASGAYGFSYTISATQSVWFLAYAATTGLAFANDAYVTGVIDPILAIDQQLTAQGTTLIAQGSTVVGIGNTLAAVGTTLVAIGNSLPILGALDALIGTTTSSYGTSSADPLTVFGYLRRIQEFLEGDQVFNAGNGQWLIYNRASLGTTTLLRTKTVINNGSQTTKSGD